jgi:hypothetical protein
MPPPLLVLSLAFIIGLLLPEWYPLTWHAPAAAWPGVFRFWAVRAAAFRTDPGAGALADIMPLPVGVIGGIYLLAGNALAMASQPNFTEKDAAWYNERGEVRIIGVIERPPIAYDRRSAFRYALSASRRYMQGAASAVTR